MTIIDLSILNDTPNSVGECDDCHCDADLWLLDSDDPAGSACCSYCLRQRAAVDGFNKGGEIGRLIKYGDTIVNVYVDLDNPRTVITVGNLRDERERLECREDRATWQAVIDRFPKTSVMPMTVEQGVEFVMAQLSREDIEYARDPNRGPFTGFGALHDRMDANMLMPFAEEYVHEEHCDYYDKVMAAVTAAIIISRHPA